MVLLDYIATAFFCLLYLIICIAIIIVFFGGIWTLVQVIKTFVSGFKKGLKTQGKK